VIPRSHVANTLWCEAVLKEMPHRFLPSTGIPPNTLQIFVALYYIGVICFSGGWGVYATSNTLSSNTIYLLTLEYRTFWVSHWATIYMFKSPSNWAFCLARDPSLLITCLDISAPNWVPKFTWSNFVHDNVLSACNRWLFIKIKKSEYFEIPLAEGGRGGEVWVASNTLSSNIIYLHWNIELFSVLLSYNFLLQESK
jgi:hypothetical protein